MSTGLSAAPARVTAGVDWAKDDHAVCVAGDQGQVLERFTVRHDAAGLRQLAARLLRAGHRRPASNAATGRSPARCWRPG